MIAAVDSMAHRTRHVILIPRDPRDGKRQISEAIPGWAPQCPQWCP